MAAGRQDPTPYRIGEEVRRDWWLILIQVLAFVGAAVVYTRLPSRVPVHWNIQGEIDGWGSPLTIFLMPITTVGIYVLLLFVPLIDPKRANYSRMLGILRGIRAVLVLFMTALGIVIAVATMKGAAGSTTTTFAIQRMLPIVMSIAFIVLGYYLPTLRPNWFIGIRTPWTLENEEVWVRTHALGGRLFVASGVIGLVGAFIGGVWAMMLLVAPLLVTAVVTVVYSYLLFSRVNGGAD